MGHYDECEEMEEEERMEASIKKLKKDIIKEIDNCDVERTLCSIFKFIIKKDEYDSLFQSIRKVSKGEL